MSIKIYKNTDLTQKTKQRLFNRSFVDFEKVKAGILPSMELVRQLGDQAILDKYQSRNIPIDKLRVTRAEFSLAQKKVSNAYKAALKQAIANIRIVNQAQKNKLLKKEKIEVQGQDIKVWRRWQPIEKIGIYVPGGRANYPSSLIMSAIPAQIAGCQQIVVCVPPDDQGQLPAEVLVAAQELEIKMVFKAGGPQAIAAMAYGTQSVPQVYKIVGPGNQYVTAAKLLVYPLADIDMPAGPSENVIIADETANSAYVAADLITDAEHGPDSTGIVLTNSLSLAKKIAEQVDILLLKISTSSTIAASLDQFGAIIITQDLSQAVELTNEYAPEHLQIMTANSQKIADQITNAGSVFLGDWTCKSSGDYATGANHVLPTGGMAKMFGPLSVETFGRLIQFQQVTKQGLATMRQTIETFAEVENLPAHKLSASVRFI